MATDCESLHNELIFDGGRADINWLSQRGHHTGKYVLETNSMCRSTLNANEAHLLNNEDQMDVGKSQANKVLNNLFIGEDIRQKNISEVNSLKTNHLTNRKLSSFSSSSMPSSSIYSAPSVESIAGCCPNIAQVLSTEPGNSPSIIDNLTQNSTMEQKIPNSEINGQKCDIKIEIEHVDDNAISSAENLPNKEPTTANQSDGDDEIGDECRPSNIRRCSSLKTGKTPPGTPGRKKIVRFADVLGLDLADVKTFLDEIPTIPKSAYEDLHNLDKDTQAISPRREFKKVLVALFQQPETLPTFLDIVNEKRVCLESACVSDATNQTITGWVRVRNLDFYKSLYIRYSFDGWRSFVDLQASYVENSCDGFSDRFTFTLYGNLLSVGQRLEFAVRFHCMGQQFWDNNDGVNYCFQCIEHTATPTKALTAAEQHPVSSKLSSSTSSIEAGPKSGAFKLRMMRAVHRPTMAAISAINLHDLKPLLQTDNILASGDLWCSAFY